jgi:mannose-6-phosphate isomerase-like protein (cupin superfamily)
MEAHGQNTVKIGSLELRFLVDEVQSSGTLVMFEMTVPPNARVPAPHHHREVDEMVYVLEGRLTMTLDGQKRDLTPGESLFVPRSHVHGFENLGPGPVRSLAVLTPGSIGRRYFEELAVEVNVDGKPDLAKIKNIMLQHGLVPA